MTKASKKVIITICAIFALVCALLAVSFIQKNDTYAMGTFINGIWPYNENRVTIEESEGAVDLTFKVDDNQESASRAYYSQPIDVKNKGLYFSLTLKSINVDSGVRISIMNYTNDDYPMHDNNSGMGFGDGFTISLWDETAWGYPEYTNLRADMFAYGKTGGPYGTITNNPGIDTSLVQENRLYGNCSQQDPKYYDPANDLYPTLYFSIYKDGDSGYKCEIRKTENGGATVISVPNSQLPQAFTPENANLLITPRLDSRAHSYVNPIKVQVANVYNGNDANVTSILPNSERLEEISLIDDVRTLSLKSCFTYKTAFGPSKAQFTYTSSNESVAKISGDNIEIPKMASGSSTITITSGSISASFVLNVSAVETGISEKSLSVGNYLTLNVYAYFFEEGVAKMQFTMGGKSKTVLGVLSDANKKEYRFSLGGIAPWQMTEQITMKLFNGSTLLETKTTSVVEYLDALYGTTKKDSLKTFVANAIAFGSEAQTYKNYKTSELASQKTTIEEIDLETYETMIEPALDVTKLTVIDSSLAQAIEVTNAGVKFDKGNKLYIKLSLGSGINKENVSVLFDGKKATLSEDGGKIVAESSEISFLGFDDKHTFTIKYGTTEVSKFDYSVESYVYSKATGTAEGDIAHATYSFGKALARYIGKDFGFPAVYTFTERTDINTTSQNYTATNAVQYKEELWDTPNYVEDQELLDCYTASDKGNVKAVYIESPVTYSHTSNELADGKKTMIAAYYGLPSGASATNKVPAIVLVHGGLGTAIPDWVKYWNDLGFAAISIDTEGGQPTSGVSNANNVHNETNKYLNDSVYTCGPSNQDFSDYNKPLEYQWMYHATSAAILGVSFISQFDCVDTQKIGMTGVSWGSVITSIVIGYDDRITFAMPVYGGITLDGAGGWVSGCFKEQTMKDRWDITDALERTDAKVFYVTSTADEPFSPDVASRCAEAAKGFVTYVPGFTHGQQQGAEQNNLPVFAKYVCGLESNYLEIMKHPDCYSNTMLLRRYGSITINSVKLYYTNSSKIVTHNSMGEVSTWQEVNIPFSFDQNSFEINCSVSYKWAYVTINYNNGYQVSTYIWEGLTAPSYDFEKYMTNIWETDIIYNESVMFMADKDGNIKDKTLLFPIDQIIEVRNNELDILYKEGEDYEVVDGKLRYIEGGKIEVMLYEDYYITNSHEGFITSIDQQFRSISQSGNGEERYYYYCENDYLISRQLAVTYKKTQDWQGPTITRDSSKLTKTMNKLENKQAIKIVYYGDSVMTGCNSSGMLGVAPYMPKSYELVNESLARHYGYTDKALINGVMTGQGGWAATNGLNGADPNSSDNKFNSNAFQTRVLDENPDLVVFHFGANDATHNFTAEQYIGFIDQMITKVLAQNANAEFLIVSMSSPNDDAIKGDLNKNMAGVYRDENIDRVTEYVAAIKEYINGKNHVAFADTSSVTRYALERKDWWDVTANNINHPNDFFIRIEAQLMVDALCK